jgi:hypothetical protein
VSFTPLPIYFKTKSPWYPMDKLLDGPQSRSGRRREENNFFPLPGIELRLITSPTLSLVTTLTELHVSVNEKNMRQSGQSC